MLHQLKNIRDTRTIFKVVGNDYTLFKKIRLKGTGSARLAYVKGIGFFTSLSESGQSISYLNFQLYPGGLVLRLSKNTSNEACAIEKDQIETIDFVSRRIKLRSKNFLDGYKIVFESLITFQLKENEEIQFYCPCSFYKSIKPYFKKDWLASKTSLTIDPAPPIDDRGSDTASRLFSIVETFT